MPWILCSRISQIAGPPVLTVQSHVQAVEGDTVILRFAISGYPHPLLHRLLHNDRELTIEEENTAGESVVIRFDEVSRADAGSYTAVVVNSLGVANATTYLEILCKFGCGDYPNSIYESYHAFSHQMHLLSDH